MQRWYHTPKHVQIRCPIPEKQFTRNASPIMQSCVEIKCSFSQAPRQVECMRSGACQIRTKARCCVVSKMAIKNISNTIRAGRSERASHQWPQMLPLDCREYHTHRESGGEGDLQVLGQPGYSTRMNRLELTWGSTSATSVTSGGTTPSIGPAETKATCVERWASKWQQGSLDCTWGKLVRCCCRDCLVESG